MNEETTPGPDLRTQIQAVLDRMPEERTGELADELVAAIQPAIDRAARGVQGWMALDVQRALGLEFRHHMEHQGHESWADWWAELISTARRARTPSVNNPRVFNTAFDALTTALQKGNHLARFSIEEREQIAVTLVESINPALHMDLHARLDRQTQAAEWIRTIAGGGGRLPPNWGDPWRKRAEEAEAALARVREIPREPAASEQHDLLGPAYQYGWQSVIDALDIALDQPRDVIE